MGALRNVQHWSGISIGSICALLMNIGVTPMEILPLIQEIPTKFSLTPQSILSVPDTFGLVSHTPFRHLLETVLEQKGILPSITFRQLYRFTKQSLSIFATNLQTNTLISFQYRTTPDVPILDAVLASCSIPIVFPPFTIEH
jgi:predicted acylesterase/phospholipase RssA